MATVSTSNILNALGAGSGIDIQALAQNLADVEISPRKDLVNNKITQTEAKISAYGYISTALQELQTAFSKLENASDFSVVTASSSQPTVLSVGTPTAAARSGSYSLDVHHLASAQVSVSQSFADPKAKLNGGVAFSLQVSSNGKSTTINLADGKTSLNDIAAAITNKTGLGIQAQVVQTTVSPAAYTLMLKGQSGLANAFELSFGPGLLTEKSFDAATTSFAAAANATSATVTYGFDNTVLPLSRDESGQWVLPDPLPDGYPQSPETVTFRQYSQTPVSSPLNFENKQDAGDAELTLNNGLTVKRSSNQISDLIPGVTLNLNAQSTSTIRVDLNLDTTALKEKFNGLVTAYNNLELTLSEVGNPKSTIKDGGGALASDSLLTSIRSQIRGLMTQTASTAKSDATIKAIRHVGLSFDGATGQLQLNADQLDKALKENFDEVVTAFSGGIDGKDPTEKRKDMLNQGLASDLVIRINQMLSKGNTNPAKGPITEGLMVTRTQQANKSIAAYQAELSKLDDRMSQLLDSYLRQFSVMQSIVGNSNSMRTSLKNSFDGMMASYSNK